MYSNMERQNIKTKIQKKKNFKEYIFINLYFMEGNKYLIPLAKST